MHKPEQPERRGPHFQTQPTPASPPDPALFHSRLMGIPVREAPILAGMKRAVFDGETLYLSPAMLELLTKADTPEEVDRLVRAFDPIRIPKFDPFKIELIPMIAEK